MKNTILIISLLLISVASVAQQQEKTYKVLSACGQCQLDMNSENGCTLAIQYGGKKYWVDGSSISDHGDEHANDGLCKTIKKAEVTGYFEGDRFKASSFKFISKKKKKEKK